MIEKYGLFDSLEGDEREYAEVDFARLGRVLGKNGVRGGAGALKVSASPSGLAVTVAPGLALIEGRYYELEDDGSGEKTLNFTAPSTNPRIDRVVLTLYSESRTIKLGVLRGTEAATPKPPTPYRNSTRYMLSLAQVRVPVGASAIDQANITDERADESLCGLHLVTADAALKAASAAQATADGAMKILREDAFATTNLREILYAMPGNSMFFADAARYYGVAGNNLPLQYGMITIFSRNSYRKYMLLNGVYGEGSGLTINGNVYIASIADGAAELTWNRIYTEKNKPTPSAIGAIPTVTGAKEGNLPVFDEAGNLAASNVKLSGFTRAKMTLSGTTLTITTVT